VSEGTAMPGGGGRSRRDRRLLVLSGLVAFFYALGLLGLALSPLLLRERPLLLVLINPTTSILLLVSARVETLPFVILATARRFAFHIVFFLIGRWYAERAVRWMEEHSGGPQPLLGFVERAFARAGWLVILVWPGPLPSVLAGSGRMVPALFVALDLTATLVSVLITRAAANAAANPLEVVLRFADRNADRLTILFIVLVVLWLVIRWLRDRGVSLGRQEQSAATDDAAKPTID